MGHIERDTLRVKFENVGIVGMPVLWLGMGWNTVNVGPLQDVLKLILDYLLSPLIENDDETIIF